MVDHLLPKTVVLRELRVELRTLSDQTSGDQIWERVIDAVPRDAFPAALDPDAPEDERLYATLRTILWLCLTSRTAEPKEAMEDCVIRLEVGAPEFLVQNFDVVETF